MDRYTHVYCTHCVNFDAVLECIESEPKTIRCEDCPCMGCECRNPEDSYWFEVRFKYIENKNN